MAQPSYLTVPGAGRAELADTPALDLPSQVLASRITTDFEAGMNLYTAASANLPGSLDTSIFHGGTQSLRIDRVTSSGAMQLFSNTQAAGGKDPIVPGQTVLLAIWMRHNRAAGAADMRLDARFNLANAGLVTITGPTTSIPANTWTRLVMRTVAPANIDSVTLTVAGTSTWQVGESAWFDDAIGVNETLNGDLDLRVFAALDNWHSSSPVSLVSRWATGPSYLFGVWSGAPYLYWSDGVTTRSFVPSHPSYVIPEADGTALWLRVTLEAANADGYAVVSFFKSTDGTTWTPLGAPAVQSVPTSIYPGSSPLAVGSRLDGIQPPTGTFRAAQVRHGINGTIIANPDFQAQPAGAATVIDSIGRVWSIVAPAAIINDPNWPWQIDSDPYRHVMQVALLRLGTTPVSIERVMPGGRVEKVRNAQNLTPVGGAIIFDDYDAPTDTPFQYRVTGTTNMSHQVVMESLGMFFLADPNLPSRAIRVLPAANAIPQWKRDAPVGVHRVLGRPDPVVVTDTRWWASGDLTLYTLTNNQREEVGEMTSLGITLALYGPAEVLGGVGRVYFVAPTVDERRVSSRGTQPEREWHLDITQVAQPSTVPVTPAFVVWQDVVDSYATWQAVVDNEIDWLDVMRDVPTTMQAPDVGWEW